MFQKRLEITEADNGFVVEWHDFEDVLSKLTGDPKSTPSSGVRIFTKMADLTIFVKNFF